MVFTSAPLKAILYIVKEVSDEQFDQLITRAMDELPQSYLRNLENVAIVMADQPSADQAERMKLDDNHLLLGLFEGVPKTMQGSGWSGLPPSKITLFKHPLLAISDSQGQLREHVKRTLWHEIAHYYGLSHADMDQRMRSE